MNILYNLILKNNNAGIEVVWSYIELLTNSLQGDWPELHKAHRLAVVWSLPSKNICQCHTKQKASKLFCYPIIGHGMSYEVLLDQFPLAKGNDLSIPFPWHFDLPRESQHNSMCMYTYILRNTLWTRIVYIISLDNPCCQERNLQIRGACTK